MKRNRTAIFRIVVGVVAIHGAVSSTFSQVKTSVDDLAKVLAEQLSSGQAGTCQQAIENIRQRFADHPEAIGGLLRKYWLAPMAKAGFNDDIVQMTQTAILADPGSMLTVEPMFRARVYALIALGRKDEALADARRFYNVCALEQTGLAVDSLAAAMEAKFGPDGEAKIRQFRMRQMTAAAAGDEPVPAASTTQPDAADAGVNSSDQMLLSILLEEKDYMADAGKWRADHRHPVAYGNLLLMAGRANEAYQYFTDLLNRARTDADLAYALERQSAAMRAQDGNLARAQSRLRRLKNGES
jgi:hypothetical protein